MCHKIELKDFVALLLSCSAQIANSKLSSTNVHPKLEPKSSGVKIFSTAFNQAGIEYCEVILCSESDLTFHIYTSLCYQK